MRVLIVNNTRIPARTYGGTERDIWALGKELVRLGHKPAFLVARGSACPFAPVLVLDPGRPLDSQIPPDTDVVHLHFPLRQELSKPCMVTIHGNGKPGEEFHVNTVFLSAYHAAMHGSRAWVYNGLDLDQYGPIDPGRRREYVLFLAKASRKVKNLKDSILIARRAGEKLVVAGGNGLSLDPKLVYAGFVGGERKNRILSAAKCLLTPVLWDEPFGLSVVEAFYFGVPVVGTPYGDLPEIIKPDVGFVSAKRGELVEAVRNAGQWSPRRCREYACDNFTAKQMTAAYLGFYETVMSGKPLNPEKPRSRPENFTRDFPMYD